MKTNSVGMCPPPSEKPQLTYTETDSMITELGGGAGLRVHDIDPMGGARREMFSLVSAR